MPAFRNHWTWYYGLSAYWFATSAKYFILLLVILPGQIEKLVPGGEKGSTWGMVFMIGAAWGVFGPSLFGFISDGLVKKLGGRSRFISLAAGLTCVSLFILHGASSVPMIIAGYLLLQVSDDLAQGPYQALIPELVPEGNRGQASAAMGLMTSAAQISIAIYGIILKDPTLIYIGLAVLNVIGAWLVAITTKGAVRIPDAEEAERLTFAQSWIEPWKNRDFFWVWFTRFLNALGFYIIVTYVRYFLSDTLIRPANPNFTDAEVAAAASDLAQKMGLGIALTGIVGALIASKVSNTWGRKKSIRVAGFIMVAAILPFIFFPSQNVVYAAALVFGIGYGLYLSADWALVSDVLPNKAMAGAQMGVWSMANTAPQILTGALGFLVDAGNRAGPGMGYKISFSLAVVAFFLSTELVTKVKGSR